MFNGGWLQRCSLIEWLLIVELVLLVTAGLFWMISVPMRRSDPDDPVSRFILVFWKVMLRRRLAVAAAVTALDAENARQYEQLKQSGDVEGIKELLSSVNSGQEFDDTDVNAIVEQSRAEHGPAAAVQAAPAQTVVLNVKVVAFSPQDQLISVVGDTVTIHTTGGAEEGGVNKVVIDLIATLLDVRPYQISLTKGHYKPNKVIQVAGIDAATFRAKTAKWA